MNYLYKTPTLFKWYYPNLVWNFSREEKCVYLTFDDGPTKEYTRWIVDLLEQFNAKATFFCLGKNALACPEEFELIKSKGHSIGNHTYNHLAGLENSLLSFLRDVRKCKSIFESKLFRPPYGRMTRKQSIAIDKEYKIIMWDVLSGDFDLSLTGDECAKAVINNSENGSIIVFHDSKKAAERLKIALPIVLETLSREGYIFKAIV